FGRRRESAKVVEDYVEAHPRARANRGGMPKEDGRETRISESLNILFDKDLASCVSRLWHRGGLLIALATIFGRAIDTARRRIDETWDTGVLTRPRQRNRTAMIDVVSDSLVKIAKRIV